MKAKRIAFCSIIASVYAVITLTTSALAFGPIQFRIAEALCILCFFTPSAVWAVTLGCFVANLFSPLPLDILFGTLATLVGCLGAAKCRNPWVLPVPVILSNMLIVGAELSWAFTPDAFWQGLMINGLQVAIGEIAVLYLLGVPLLRLLQRSTAADYLHTL